MEPKHEAPAKLYFPHSKFISLESEEIVQVSLVPISDEQAKMTLTVTEKAES
jgi:hypothetical protein